MHEVIAGGLAGGKTVFGIQHNTVATQSTSSHSHVGGPATGDQQPETQCPAWAHLTSQLGKKKTPIKRLPHEREHGCGWVRSEAKRARCIIHTSASHGRPRRPAQ